MKTIKLLDLILILCLVSGCFVGCAEDNTASVGSESNTTSLSSTVPTDAEPQDSPETDSGNSSVNTSSANASSEETSSESISKPEEEEENDTVKPPERDPSLSETEQWYMMLVNPSNSVSNEVIESVDRSTINSSYTTGRESSKYLDSRVTEAFELMCKAAAKDGIKLYAVSAYRTYDYQETLFERRIQKFITQGYHREKATEMAATIVARPGTSEHHLGLAVDINSVEESFENTKEFEWLQKHAEDYGFIMRYPKDKQDITQIIYEPWHYRYVGVEHAREINRSGLCFEEYVEYLNGKETQGNN